MVGGGATLKESRNFGRGAVEDVVEEKEWWAIEPKPNEFLNQKSRKSHDFFPYLIMVSVRVGDDVIKAAASPIPLDNGSHCPIMNNQIGFPKNNLRLRGG